MFQRHQTYRLTLVVALLMGLHSATYTHLWARTRVAEAEAPPKASLEAITPRAFLPLVANMLPEPCQTTQPALPAPGLWSFVLNFDRPAPLQGCLMYAEGLTNTLPTIQLFDCFVSDPAHVRFLEEDNRGFARFDGAGYIYCPTFDPPASGTGLRRERKSLVAVARSAEVNAARQNPLLYHPYSTGISSKADIAYDMPVIPDASGASVGLVTHHLGNLGDTKTYTSPTGGSYLGWNVLSSDMRQVNTFLVLTHTINGLTQTFAGREILFNFDAITLTVGYNPETGQYLKSDLDELILDPKRASGGT